MFDIVIQKSQKCTQIHLSQLSLRNLTEILRMRQSIKEWTK